VETTLHLRFPYHPGLPLGLFLKKFRLWIQTFIDIIYPFLQPNVHPAYLTQLLPPFWQLTAFFRPLCLLAVLRFGEFLLVLGYMVCCIGTRLPFGPSLPQLLSSSLLRLTPTYLLSFFWPFRLVLGRLQFLDLCVSQRSLGCHRFGGSLVGGPLESSRFGVVLVVWCLLATS